MSSKAPERPVPATSPVALADAVRRIATAPPVTDQLFTLLAETARELLHAPGALVSTLEGTQLRCRAVAGDVRSKPGDRLLVEQTMAGLTLRTGQAARCDDGWADPRTDERHNRSKGVRSSAIAPLLYRGRALGTMSVLSPERARFTDDDVATLTVLADVAATRLAYALALDEQAQVQGRLDDQQRLLTAVLDALDEGLVVRDLNGHLLMANASASRITHTDLDGLQGLHGSRLPWVLRDESGAELEFPVRPAQIALRSGEVQPRQTVQIERADGSSSYLSVRAHPVRDQLTGELTGTIAAFRDVTRELEDRRELENTQRRLVAAEALTGLATWEWDLATGHLVWSDRMFELVGFAPGSIDPTFEQFIARVHPDDRDECRKLGEQAVDRGVGYQNVFRVVHDDGQVHHLLAWTELERDDRGAVVALRGATVDVSDRVRATALATMSEQRFRMAFENAPIGMHLLSLREGDFGRIEQANDAFYRMTRFAPGTALRFEDVTWPEDLDRDLARLHRLADGEGPETLAFEKRYRRADGGVLHAWLSCSLVRDEHGRPLYLVSHSVDMTERMQARQELERLALTDTLTGLANRALLNDRLSQGLARLRRGHGLLAVFMLDLDRFKLVNDTLGHQAGDALLVQVAARLRSVCRADATIGRPGGDEFVIVDALERSDDVRHLAERLLDALRGPYDVPDARGPIVATASIGVAVAQDSRPSPEDLLREADLALYRAKDGGRDRWALFDDALRARALHRVDVEQRLRTALADDRLRVVYQPVVALRPDLRGGPEALVRIDDAELGELPPGAFIEVAEDTGLIVDVDRRVLDVAVHQFADWQRLPGLDIPCISVNVSARSIEAPGFADEVVALLDRTGVPGDALRLEVTERTLLEASPGAVEALDRLTALGVGFGIDDFGTGYSALAYLQRFPLHFLKIDRSFTSMLGHSTRDDALVAAIIALGHAQDLHVVAEGVEAPEQLEQLRLAGCDLAQGYLVGRPMPSDVFVAHVRAGTPGGAPVEPAL